MDNSIVVAYINKQEGTHSAGYLNVMADLYSLNLQQEQKELITEVHYRVHLQQEFDQH